MRDEADEPGIPHAVAVADEAWLRAQAAQLVAVSGVVGVVLGGSRARGEHRPDSDVDFGLYYRPPLDVTALEELAREVSGPQARVTQVGAWGPWVDGGAWLQVDGVAVDWLYRDLDRVQRAWDDARQGRCRWHAQAGHPLGVPDIAYAGEMALAVVLADPTAELTRLQEQMVTYPRALSDALVEGLWEARFLLDLARKGVPRADSAYVAGCLFRVVGVCAHALHGRAGQWLINEKGAVAAAGRLSVAPTGFTERATHLLGQVGTTSAELAAALNTATALIEDTAAACAR